MARFAVALVLVLSVAAGSLAAPTKKVEASLAQAFARDATHKTNIVVSFDGTSKILSQVSTLAFETRGAKLNALRANLGAHAAASQKNVLAILAKSPEVHFKSFWANNKVFVRDASAALVSTLAALDEVTEIRQEKILHLINPTQARPASPIQPLAEWGLEDIQAPEAWAAGFTGEGVVVATIDTGARGTHNELVDSHRSEYGW